MIEELIVVSICLILNGFLAAFEMAFVSAPRAELRVLARKGIKNAQKILTLRENLERTLSIIQIGITLVGTVGAGVAGAGAVENLGPWVTRFGGPIWLSEAISIVIVVLPITYLNVVVGELVPKALALRSPIKITLVGADFLLFVDRMFSPLVTVLETSTKWILKVFFPILKKKTSAADLTIEIDTLAQHHQQAILNLAGIEKKAIKDILLGWKDVDCVRLDNVPEEVTVKVFSSGHTRLPVVDPEGDVVGVLHTKEFLALREAGNPEWKKIIRPILKIKASDTLLYALRLMQSKRSHLATVYSARGELLGIVTLEDISEEIWGEIFDEDDDGQIRKLVAERVKIKGIQKA